MLDSEQTNERMWSRAQAREGMHRDNWTWTIQLDSTKRSNFFFSLDSNLAKSQTIILRKCIPLSFDMYQNVSVRSRYMQFNWTVRAHAIDVIAETHFLIHFSFTNTNFFFFFWLFHFQFKILAIH